MGKVLKNIKNHIVRNKYSYIVFSFFLIVLVFESIKAYVVYNNINFSGYTLSYFLFSYKFGFGARSFIGSILDLLISGPISFNHIWSFVLIANILLIVLVSFLFGCVVKKCDLKTKKVALFLVLVYCASSANISYFFNVDNFGRLDLFFLIDALCILICLQNKWARWLIPLLFAVGVAIHTIFAMILAPTILLILIYETISSKWNKKLVILTCLSIIFLSGSFIYFQFFSRYVFNSSAEMIKVLTENNNLAISNISINCLYMTLKEQIVEFILKIKQDLILNLIFGVLFSLPVILFFLITWIKAIKKSKSKLKKLFFYCVILIPLICLLPSFLLGCDYGRWFAMGFISQFIMLFYFIYKKDSAIVLVLEEYYKKWKNKLFVLSFIILFLSFQGVFLDVNINKYLYYIVKFIKL